MTEQPHAPDVAETAPSEGPVPLTGSVDPPPSDPDGGGYLVGERGPEILRGSEILPDADVTLLPADVAEADDVEPDDQAAAAEFVDDPQQDEAAEGIGVTGDTSPAADDADEGTGE